MALRAQNNPYRFAAALAALLAIAAACVLGAGFAGSADAKSKKKAKKTAAAKNLPSVSKLDPPAVDIGGLLVIKGKKFTQGPKKMRVVFQRDGGKRFTARGTATASDTMTVVVPNVSADMPGGTPTKFRLRLINKYGIAKKSTSDKLSPTISIPPGALPGDCDNDKVLDATDPDDDNDLLSDAIEASIFTDPCLVDTDGDEVSDYYEHRMALDFNGAPVLPYPWQRPTPDPLSADGDVNLDGDNLSMAIEYRLWQYTGRMDRFYSDVMQDSDLNGTTDDLEDEDGDLLRNIVELVRFGGAPPLRELDFLDPDSDGDGLCDGLDDLDHDGPPTAVADGDCTTPVPNNTVPGDPNPSLTDGDDNVYSNIGEILAGTDPYDACDPNPAAPFCPLPAP